MPELICDRCHQNYPVWFTENDLWNKIGGGFSFLCPTCFCFLALVVDYKTTGWFLTVEERASNTEQNNTAVALLKEAFEAGQRSEANSWFFDNQERVNAVLAQSPPLPNNGINLDQGAVVK